VIHAHCVYIVIGNKKNDTKWKLARLPRVTHSAGEENLLHLNENQNCVMILHFYLNILNGHHLVLSAMP